MGITDMWDQLVNCICRPPRDSEYTVEDLIGGRAGVFSLPGYKGYTARREDLVLTNKRGMKLQCSHYVPEKVQGKDGRLPCVIYCHCNSGSRRDCEEALYQLLPLGISVFALDFAGSGLSEGNWVSLGAHEVEDVAVAVGYLRGIGGVSTLGLWGRSMGAVTALLYSQRDPSIAGIVLDSPFSSLTELMMEIVDEQQLPVPKALMKVALAAMKRSVRKRAEFDISEVTPLTVVPQSFIPALFGHAHGDSFIKIHHSERLYAAYAGDKNFIKVEGDHNSPRPAFFKNSVAIFFTTVLQLDEQLLGGNSSYVQHMREFAAAAATAAASGASGREAAPPPPLPSVSSGPRPGQGAPWQLESLRSANSIPRLPVSTSPRADPDDPDLPTPGLQRVGLALFSGSQGASDEDALLLQQEQEQLQELEEDAELMLAIEASLRDQQDAGSAAAPGTGQERSQQTAWGGGGREARGTVPAQAAVVPLPHPGPASAEDEDEMLRAAIALSLGQSAGAPASSSTVANSTPSQGVTSTSGTGPQNYVDLLVRELSGGMKENAV